LASQKEISSTEKLLDLIRSEKAEEEAVSSLKSPSPGKITSPSFSSFLSGRSSLSVGIDIGYHHLHLIKVEKTGDDQWELLDYRRVPFRTDAPSGTPEFTNFLKFELDKFIGPARGVKVWANMSSARVEVASVRIPKVPKKQLENAVFWTAKRTISFEEKDVVFDFNIEGEVVEGGAEKLAVMVYAAPKKEVAKLQDLFVDIGYPLDGLTIAPFGIQNIFKSDWLPAFEQTVATLYIGRSWSRIDVFSKGDLVMTRGIRTGLNSMTEELMEGYNEQAERGTPQGSETPYMEMEEAREVLYGLSPDSPDIDEMMQRFDLDDASVMNLIRPALDRLVRQVERTFQHYTVTLGNERIDKIYVSTAMNTYRPIVDYIGDELGTDRDLLDPIDPAVPQVGGITSGVCVSDRVTFGPALGAALSDFQRTPNLLFTYKDKTRRYNIAKGNKTIFLSLSVILVVFVGILFVLGTMADKKKTVLANLERQLQQGMQVDEKVIPIFVSKIERDRQYIRRYSDRYRGLAVVREISTVTPPNIRLLNLSVHMGDLNSPRASKEGGSLAIEGFVSGDVDSLEDNLVEYVLKLQSSPAFRQAKIKRSSIETFDDRDVLRFTLTVKLV